jgi:NAD(P)-dependent dehydrogenase (short-subunit alcohol dehydrogenase family)
MSESEADDDAAATGRGGESGLSVRDVAVVTGCSSGIGRATALALAEEGWRVYATGRDTADMADLDGEAGIELARLDVTEAGAARSVVEEVVADAGRIDLVVNNAGYAQLGPVEDVPVARVRRQFDVNVFGPHRVVRAALPQLREQGEGTVVTVSSAAGRVAFPGGGVYSGAEHAKEAMTDALRAEVEDLGIDVVLVEPGPVDTEFSDRAERELRAIERTDDYGAFYSLYDDTATIGGWPGAVDPEAVAEAIVEAATCADPAARYPVGRLARLAAVGRYLPDRIRDGLFGLARLLS